MTEIDGSAIDDILNSPTKENQPPEEEPIEPIATAPPVINEDSIVYPELNQDDLPGSIENIPNLEEKRPSTTLEVGPDGVAMVESSALPARLPPLRNSSQEGDLDGYRQNIDVISNFSERRYHYYPRIPLTDANINDLLNTLECPVCLDTADSPPIYQCPEGHLLCQRCNQRLVDCPQCGHALMNSRNRIAEDLAIKLQILRGNTTGSAGNQKIALAVSEPHKRKGFFGGVVYNIITKYYGEQFASGSSNSHFSVTRSYKDIQNLYKYLNLSYQKHGVIIPPPPPKANLSIVDTVQTAGAKNLTASAASRSIDKKCVALDRYMKRLGKHPVVRKDAMFRSFIQDKEVAKTLKPLVGFKSALEGMKSGIATFQSKITVTEKDPWFKTRHGQLKALSQQMDEMHKNLRGMAALKHQLHDKSDEFRRDLVMLLVGRSTVRENDFAHIIDQVVDAQRIMSTLYDEQADADDHLVQISEDYKLMIIAAQDTLIRRRKVQMRFEKEEKKAKKKSVKMVKKEETSEAPIEEITNELSDVEKAEEKFNGVSQTLRRELEHFDYVMREEFEKAFAAYGATYFGSLSKSKIMDDSSTRPTTELLALTVEEPKQYEEMSAVSYHM